MKKIALTLAIILGMSMTTFADGGGLFQRGNNTEERGGFMNRDPQVPGLPNHGEEGDQPAPLGSGALLLIGFGAAYAMSKRNKK